MQGYLLIDKPKGWTSHDVVAKVRSELSRKQITETRNQITENRNQRTTARRIKVGHAGTLDPMATGLLIVLVGSYTKRQDYFMKLDKIYEAEITLGAISDTDDAEGQIQETGNRKRKSEEEVTNALDSFLGEQMQTPPQYSAIKVKGQTAYNVARKGKKLELKPRQVTIFSIENIKYHWPKLSLTIKVSSGTYIRSLARDLGQKLGIGGYLSQLRRVAVGSFDLKDAISADGKDTQSKLSVLQKC